MSKCRAVLQVIADFTGFNIITSDTVGGNTLRLKDVPWDQALDIVMRAKGLDMRKNGNVVWIAPRDGFADQGEAGAGAEIPDCGTGTLAHGNFPAQLHQSHGLPEDFGIKEDGTSDPNNKNRLLSKRGSAVLD